MESRHEVSNLRRASGAHEGLEVSPEVVEALGGAKRPPVIITINGHSWRSRVAIMRGRFVLGLSNANRQAAGVATGDEVEVDVEFDPEPRVVVEPADFARALDSDPVAVPPTTAWPTATSASTCTPSRARRNPRRAHLGSRRRWQRCGSRNRQQAARPAPRASQRGDPIPDVGWLGCLARPPASRQTAIPGKLGEKLKAGYATTTRVSSLSAGSQSSTSVATDFAQRAKGVSIARRTRVGRQCAPHTGDRCVRSRRWKHAQLWLLKRTRQRDARPNARADIHEAFLQIAGCRVKRS
jgi:hypothetical protein